MESRNKTAKPRRKRRGTRTKSAWPKPTMISFGSQIGFPDSLTNVRLKYSDRYPFSLSAAPAAQVFRANSAFDPDLTGVGHQPDFFDQLAAIYQQYCVTGCLAKLAVSNLSTTVPIFLSVWWTDVNNSSQSVEASREAKYGKFYTVGPSTGAHGSMDIVIPRMSSNQIQGMKDVTQDPNNYQLVTVNPTDQWFLIIKVESADGSSTVNAQIEVLLIQDMLFRELQQPAES